MILSAIGYLNLLDYSIVDDSTVYGNETVCGYIVDGCVIILKDKNYIDVRCGVHTRSNVYFLVGNRLFGVCFDWVVFGRRRFPVHFSRKIVLLPLFAVDEQESMVYRTYLSWPNIKTNNTYIDRYCIQLVLVNKYYSHLRSLL